jgi:ribosomal protein L9
MPEPVPGMATITAMNRLSYEEQRRFARERQQVEEEQLALQKEQMLMNKKYMTIQKKAMEGPSIIDGLSPQGIAAALQQEAKQLKRMGVGTPDTRAFFPRASPQQKKNKKKGTWEDLCL